MLKSAGTHITVWPGHWLGWIAFFVLFVIAAPDRAETKLSYPIPVFVSILPEQYFVKRVGGEFVKVTVMVGPGQSPATYDPKPKQIAELERAIMYFRIGVPFENMWMNRIRSINSTMRIVDLRDGITLRAFSTTDQHEHGGNKDPHVWTSPPLVKHMAGHIRAALIQLDPAHRVQYESNYNAFARDLDELNDYIKNIMARLKTKNFMVFHPSWGYFADTYGLHQISIESEGKEPGAKALTKLIEFGKSEGVKVIFVQTQFSMKTAQTIAHTIGAQVVTVDPLAENYLTNMRMVAEAFAKSLSR